MKKKAILLAVSLTLATTPALADVYVKIDANGNAIDGPIVCDSITCGEGSLYSQLTLGAGERYALQGYGTTGIGANNPDTQVQVTPENVWTVTTPTSTQVFTPERVIETTYVAPVITETQTVLTDTSTVTITDTTTATVTNSVTLNQLMEKVTALMALVLRLLARLGA
jgi:hypothetical protein